MSSFLSAGQNQRQQEGAEQTSPTQQLGAHLADTMRTLSLLTLLALAALCLSDLTGMCPPGSFLWVTTLLKVSQSALGWQRGRDNT